MRWPALLLALLLPACRGTGTEGLPPPAMLDMARLVRPGTPNTALAAPAGFAPAPDLVTPRYQVAPRRLYDSVRDVALAQPRTFLHAADGVRLQAHFVARSRWFNFPDLITVQITPDSGLILWSRSVHGRSDFGVNRARLETWLTALDRSLAAP